jgi:hypothetical protein
MAETSNRRLSEPQGAGTTSPSMTEMKAAIGETRGRLALGLTRTADHVHVLFSAAAPTPAESRDHGLIGGAATAIVIAGRTRRAWGDARRTGLLRRVAIGAATVALAVAFAAYRRRA